MRITLTRRRIETFIAALVAIAAATVGIAVQEGRTLGPKFVTLQRIARMREPVYLTQPPGQNQLYVVQKRGAVRIIANDHLLARPFLDIHRLVKHNGPGGDPGMAAIAFPPDYSRTGLFYVSYNDRQDNLQVDEYRRSADNPLVADPGSRRPILTIAEPTEAHHGGLIVFGPDGYLYMGTGDGGPAGDPAGNAQNLDLLLGKLLRIDPTPPSTASTKTAAEQKPYSVPPDNPFVGRPGRHRRRRQQPLRGDRLPADRPLARRELRLAGIRGQRRLQGRSPTPGRGLPRPRLSAPPRLRRDRRLRRPRPAPGPDPGQGATCREAAQLPLQHPLPLLARRRQQRPYLRPHRAQPRPRQQGLGLPARSLPQGDLAARRRRSR
jgi:hypothetical protein